MRYKVVLYTEQRAEVEVELPDDEQPDPGTRGNLTQAALAQLDESGGAEWETTLADVESWTPVGR